MDQIAEFEIRNGVENDPLVPTKARKLLEELQAKPTSPTKRLEIIYT